MAALAASPPQSAAPSAYPLSNRHPNSSDHHRALAALLDPPTFARIAALGDLTGTTCLEVGAGRGSVARWLTEQVGPTGTVIATDLEPAQIPACDRLTVVRHDLRGDDPVPVERAGLIHGRLVLSHLANADRILRRLVERLAPGGVILIEDWAALRTQDEVVVDAPSPDAAALYGLYQKTVGEAVFDSAETDRMWARSMHTRFLAAGLTDVRTEVHTLYWTGGDAGCRLVAAVLRQVRPRLLAAGMTDEQLSTVLDLLNDPRLIIHGHPMYSTSGRRPDTPDPASTSGDGSPTR